MVHQKVFAFEEKKLSAEQCVDQAKGWAETLIHHESRRPGDFNNAMRRIGRHIGVPYSVLWALRYRRPKNISASIFLALAIAYERLRAKGIQRVDDEISLCQTAGVSEAVLRRIAATAGAVCEDNNE